MLPYKVSSSIGLCNLRTYYHGDVVSRWEVNEKSQGEVDEKGKGKLALAVDFALPTPLISRDRAVTDTTRDRSIVRQ
jgi:hypothetical protein